MGDWYSGTGPANVTKYYIENLQKGTLYQRFKSKILRAPELIVKIVFADVVCFSGYSKQNILGLKVAKMFKRPTAYIMHGCVEYENEINLEPDEEMNRVERATLLMADRILAVSPSFASWLQNHYPEHRDKIDYVSNAIDDELLSRAKSHKEEERDGHMIFSVGGGMPRKKIKYVSEAVGILRESFDPELRLVIAGAKGADSDIIGEYDFVDNKGLLSFDEITELYKRARVFVQNSCFETFGLAMVEAISLGCSTLCYKDVGALCLIDNYREEDVVEHFDDPHEIADKIKQLILVPNSNRLAENIDWEQNSWKQRSRMLEAKLSQLLK